jgi:hypothetical protein
LACAGLIPSVNRMKKPTPITHTSRTGSTYYLHTGPKRGGGTQHFFSTKPAGLLAHRLPDGFEVHETVNGQVHLRRRRPKLIRDDELDCIRSQIDTPRAGHRYQVEARGDVLTIHESSRDLGLLAELAPHLSPREDDRLAEHTAHYQPVLRFILVDAERRLFAPERYCFRGSVDDWISIGPPATVNKLAVKYLKHLGQDSMFDLF